VAAESQQKIVRIQEENSRQVETGHLAVRLSE